MSEQAPHADVSSEERSVPVYVTSQALDVLFKLEAEHLIPLIPARFGVALAPIRRHLPTELPRLDLHLERLDRVFELADATILDYEFEAELSMADLRRFVGYGLGLLEAYPDHPVRTLALCGPRTHSVPQPIDLAPIPYRLTCVLVGNQDGEATIARLHDLTASGQLWSDVDRVDLVLLPLMRQERGTEAVAREGLALARALPTPERSRAMGALLALAYHYEGEAVLNRLVEGLMSTNLLDEIFAQKLNERRVQWFAQGVEQGRAQGIEQGVAQGRAEEARLLLRRYLEQRFGAIPSALDERIAAADADTLTALFERALAGTAIDTLWPVDPS